MVTENVTPGAGVQDAVADAAGRADRLDPILGTFLHRFTEEAAAAAKELDEATAHGAPRGPLHGLLVGVKDLIAVREAPTTGQSAVYDPGWWAGRDAVAVERLRAAGAVIVGKTTLAEYGLARPDPASDFPVPRNPWDLERWPGGSSCGSANGIPAGFFTAALGTDSNGSLRIPAAMCGVTGLKPTYGLVPIDGTRPLGRSVDVVGPLASDARDCGRILAVLAGREEPAWLPDLQGVRLGVPFEALGGANLSEDCQQAFRTAIGDLQRAGAEIVRIDLPEAMPLIAAEFVTLVAEAYEVHREALRERWEEYGRPFRWSVVIGGLIDAATYLRAQRIRAWAAFSVGRRLSEVDAIATPTWPGTAPRYDDAERLQEMSGLPGMWNSAGFPAIAVPMGVGSDGLPLSLQLAGAPYRDFRLAAIADAYQRETGWHRARPRISAEAQPATVVLSSAPEASTEDAPPAEAIAAFAGAVRATGVPVADEELPHLFGGFMAVQQLSAALPDLPADVGPLATVRLG